MVLYSIDRSSVYVPKTFTDRVFVIQTRINLDAFMTSEQQGRTLRDNVPSFEINSKSEMVVNEADYFVCVIRDMSPESQIHLNK